MIFYGLENRDPDSEFGDVFSWPWKMTITSVNHAKLFDKIYVFSKHLKSNLSCKLSSQWSLNLRPTKIDMDSPMHNIYIYIYCAYDYPYRFLLGAIYIYTYVLCIGLSISIFVGRKFSDHWLLNLQFKYIYIYIYIWSASDEYNKYWK